MILSPMILSKRVPVELLLKILKLSAESFKEVWNGIGERADSPRVF